jgi:hypothetical protein
MDPDTLNKGYRVKQNFFPSLDRRRIYLLVSNFCILVATYEVFSVKVGRKVPVNIRKSSSSPSTSSSS